MRPVSEDDAGAGAGGGVTVVIRRRVRPGHEAAYETALANLQADGARFEGYLGATTQRPAAPAAEPVYTSVIRFASVEQLRDFERSARRAAFIAEVAPHVQADAAWQEVSGLEFWFSPPPGTVVPQPVRWRMALVMVVVVYGLVLTIGSAVAWALQSWPGWLRLLITIGIEVAFMTWWLMPRLTRWLAPWIFPRRITT
jgi:antibiotic biosynthesis monooxygenase (ABM) superfamily enzyme